MASIPTTVRRTPHLYDTKTKIYLVGLTMLFIDLFLLMPFSVEALAFEEIRFNAEAVITDAPKNIPDFKSFCDSDFAWFKLLL